METLEEWRSRVAGERFRQRVRAAGRLKQVPPEVTFKAYAELIAFGRKLSRVAP